jgi:hypothetical protein
MTTRHQRRGNRVLCRTFEAIDEGAVFDEEQYSAFRQGDAILVRLDGEEPEVKHFKGYGWRTPIFITGYIGENLDYVRTEGKDQIPYYQIHKSRVISLLSKS